jgi:hypothetical protein
MVGADGGRTGAGGMMTVIYDKDGTFLGVRLTDVRNLLRAWQNCRRVIEAAKQKSVQMDFRTAAVLADEADRQGLFAKRDQEGYGPTDSADALISATPMKPLPREKVPAILDGLFANCAACNLRADLPFRVNRVWLFGSYAQGAAMVNDIDVVVETERTPLWSMKDPRFIEMAEQLGGTSAIHSRGMPYLDVFQFLERRLVFGARRHPRLAPADISILKDLACPCQLVFDAARGGPVIDPVLPRHPDSSGRTESARERFVMPDLREDLPLVPVHAGLIAPNEIEAMRADVVVAAGRGADWRFGRLLYLPDIQGNADWPKELAGWGQSLVDLDGREVCAIVWRADGTPIGWQIRRSIEDTGDHYVYRLDVAASRFGQRRDSMLGLTLGASLVCLASTDAERIARQAVSAGRKFSLEVEAENGSGTWLGEVAVDHLLDVVAEDGATWLTPFARLALTNPVVLSVDDAA